MRHFGITLEEGTSIKNMVPPSGIAFPTAPDNPPDAGELFFRTDLQDLYSYIDGEWVSWSSSSGGGASVGVLGVAATKGDILYLASDGKYYLAQANSEVACSGLLAIANDDGDVDEVITIITANQVLEGTDFEIGAGYYISATVAGEMTTERPSAANVFIRLIGYAKSATEFVFLPDSTVLELGEGEEGGSFIAQGEIELGDAVIKGDILRQGLDGKYHLTKADSAETATGFLVIANDAGDADDIIIGIFPGGALETESLVVGAEYFLSDTVAGGITNVAPSAKESVIRSIGYAISEEQLIFVPSNGFVGVSGNFIEAVDTNITIDVGDGEDYETIPAAIEYLVRKRPILGEVRATINLKADFVMRDNLYICNGLNLSWITIVGEDSETVIDPTNFKQDGAVMIACFAADQNSALPIIQQLFAINPFVEYNGHGIVVTNRSYAEIGAGCGIKNCVNGMGLYVNAGSYAYATNSEFSGCQAGVVAEVSGNIDIGRANITNCVEVGITSSSDSRVYAVEADCSGGSNGPEYPIIIEDGGYINAARANLIGSSEGIYIDSGSIIILTDADIRKGEDPDEDDILLMGGSTVYATGMTGGYPQPANIRTELGLVIDTTKPLPNELYLKNVIEDEGDLVVGGADGVATALPIGFSGQVLSILDDEIVWADPAGGSGLVNVQNASGNYTLDPDDNGSMIVFSGISGSSATVTFPKNTTKEIAIGTQVDFLLDQSGKKLTFVGEAGVTISSIGNLVDIVAQGGAATVIKIATDRWFLTGALESV